MRWWLYATVTSAIAYEVVTAIQRKGDTISEVYWGAADKHPLLHLVVMGLAVHFVAGRETWHWFRDYVLKGQRENG